MKVIILLDVLRSKLLLLYKKSLPPQHTVRFRKAQLDLPCGKNMKSTDLEKKPLGVKQKGSSSFLFSSASPSSVCSEERAQWKEVPDASKYHMAANQTRTFPFSEETCSQTLFSQSIYFPLHFLNTKKWSNVTGFQCKVLLWFLGLSLETLQFWSLHLLFCEFLTVQFIGLLL